MTLDWLGKRIHKEQLEMDCKQEVNKPIWFEEAEYQDDMTLLYGEEL